MANYTPNLNLEKPLQTEDYDVDVFNANADKIDTFAGQIPARALTADKLTTGAKINGVNFKGDTDITLPVATTNVAGTVKPDGETILIDDGTISATIPQQIKHALKGYLDEGEALTDTELYNDVHSYANSTFDISKFTVVGTPTITADGIASNLDTSNYLTAIPSSMYYNKSNWHLQLEGKFDPTIICSFMGFDNDDNAYLQYEAGWHSIVLQLYDVNNEQIFVSIENADEKFVEGDILLDVYYSSTTGYYFTATQNGTTYTSETSSNKNQLKNASTQPLLYIHSTSTISIDLKTIKFFVDNQIVFNGNKTGEDVIVSGSSYTTSGNITVTDGIASGTWNFNSCITSTINYTGDSYDTFELYLGKYYFNNVTTAQWFYRNTVTVDGVQSGFMIQINAQGKLRWFAGTGASNWDITSGHISSTAYSVNSWVAIKLTFNGSVYKLYSSVNGGAWTEVDSVTSNLKILFPSTLSIGTSGTGSGNFLGQVNINGIRTIIDNSIKFALIGLSIPYILSSTGSKIVDSAYKDSVIALYRQEGKALYYTIDYINKNVTLPMGEVYGFIEENKKEIETKQTIGDWCITEPTTTSTATINKPAVIVENYINGKDGYRVWSDGFIEQWGYKATTANVAQEYTVSLLKTFSNTNYYFDRSPDWYTSTGAGLSSFFDNGYTLKSTTEVKFKMHESSAQNGTDWYAFGY